MSTRKLRIVALIVLAQNPIAASSAPLLHGINLLTMLESTTSVLTTLGDYSVLNPDGFTDGTARIGSGGLSWTGNYSSAGWSYAATGIFGNSPLAMSYSSTLTGADGSDIVVSFTGSGSLGSEPLTMNGSAEWAFDSITNQYITMIFSEETKIGSASWFGWLRGFEYVGGATVGTLAGIGAGIGTSVTGPGAVVIGVAAGATVGIGATAGLLTISNTIKSDLTSAPAPPPPVPPPPFLPFLPSTQVALATDVLLVADDMSNRYRSSGTYSAGTFSGTTMNVPEPGAIWLTCLALMALRVSRRKGEA